MEKGKFIVLEGINGCGKGTQLFRLVKSIYESDRSRTVFVTREPNEFDENGRNARRIMSSDGDPYSNAIEAVGYFAKNRQTHNQMFIPMLLEGIGVVSDRYYNSNFAFQHAQGIPYEEIAKQNRTALVPDLTVILDVPVEVAFKRLEKRAGTDRRETPRNGDERRKFDKNYEFMEKVRANYLEQPQSLPDLVGDRNIVVIDGTKSPDDIQVQIWNAYLQKFDVQTK